jgi:asparagine N-glycosylation enzyme membrane subunit Stt3
MTNIFKIKDEESIDFILEKYKFNLVIVMYVSIQTIPKDILKKIKKLLKRNLAKDYQDIYFLYVNIDDYKNTNNKYSQLVNNNNIPYAQYFLNNNLLCSIDSVKPEELINVLKAIKKDIDNNVYKQDTQNNQVNIIEQQLNQQKKMEKIQEMKTAILLKELNKIKKLKEFKENSKNN